MQSSIEYAPRIASVPMRGTTEPVERAGGSGNTAHATHSRFLRTDRKAQKDGGDASSDGNPSAVKEHGHRFAYQAAAIFSPLLAAAVLTGVGLKTHDPHYVVYAFGTVIASTFVDIGVAMTSGVGGEASAENGR
jgi:hypothetical protein